MLPTLGNQQKPLASAELFTDKRRYLAEIKSGISGALVKQLLSFIPELRPVLVSALSTTNPNLSRFYNKALNRHQSEEVLDILRVLSEAQAAFGDDDMAKTWLNTAIPALDGDKPISLLDTFVGRALVSDAISLIRSGDFS